MGSVVKYVVWVAGGIVAFFALAGVALYLFFDPNDFREDIASAVKSKTGRDLVIEGDISLSWFPWLAVDVGKTSLGNAPGFGDEPIARIDRVTLSVRLLPIILQQKIIVGGATVEGFQLNLQVNKQGNDNWSSLIAEDMDDAEEGELAAPEDLNINRIDIKDATITYSDAATGDVYTLDANLHIGHLRGDGTPVPLDSDFRFDLQPAGISGDAEISTRIAFDADAATVSLQPVDITSMGVHMTVAIEPFSYEKEISPQARIEVDAFSPREVMALLDIVPPETADPDALSSLAISATAEFGADAFKLSDVTIALDDTTFRGALSAPSAAAGAYRFDLEGDKIDLNRYMAPAEGSDGGSTDSAAVEIPADLIKPLNAHGKLKIATATVGDIVLNNVLLELNAGNGRLRLYPMSADLFGGSYNGDVQINASGRVPTLSVNEKIAGVDLADLAQAMFKQDNVTGTINGQFTLSGEGEDMVAIQRSLAGNVSFELRDGTFEGTDLWYELRSARAKLRGSEPPEQVLPAKTSFGKIKASGVVAKGVLKNDDLFAELPFMQLTGAGTINLAEATLNYGMTARILERPEFLAGATPEELDEFTEAVIPLKITGPLANPSVKPDLEKLLRQRVEDEIKDRLEDKLKDLFN
jgi:AsmA protein